jgi:hypothetical protein
MTVPSGQLSFSDIGNEFGYPPNYNLGAYRILQSVAGREWALDTGIPSSTNETIRFSHFQGKTLNVVVDYSGGETTSVGTAKDNYTNYGVVIGGLTSLPDSTKTKKVYHVIRRKIGNGFDSGTWDANTVLLQFIITGSGSIFGYGGNGGNGANLDDNGDDGTAGGHALSVSYNSTVVVESSGILAGGGGGGGGGGYQYNSGPDARGAGGGGGGGAGFPAGSGGAAGRVNNGGRNNNVCQGKAGSAGSLFTGGAGAIIDCNLTGGGRGGNGGNGGDLGEGGDRGQNKSNGTGGNGGAAGNAIYHPGYTVNLSNSGSVYGSY